MCHSVFAEVSYAGFSMADVAARAGVAKGTLYLYFKTKEELLLALADSGALLRYAAAARAGDLRALATPATLDIGSLDLGQEDHSTNAPTTVARTDAALDALGDVLATEVLSARWLLRLNQTVDLGLGTAAALDAVEAVLGGLAPGATTEDRHAAVRDALDTTILDAAEGTLEPSIGR